MVRAHIHFLHHLLMDLWRAFHERLVLISGEFRQFLKECHDVPKKSVVVRHAPGRHARELEPMFYHPEFLRWGEVGSAPEFGRSRIKPPADLGPFHAGSEMTAAAHL